MDRTQTASSCLRGTTEHQYTIRVTTHVLPDTTEGPNRGVRLTAFSSSKAVNAQFRVPFRDLLTLHVGQRLDGWQARVLSECDRDRVQRGGKRAHGILLYRRNLV